MSMSAVVKATNLLIGKTYELSLTKGYVAHWGAVQAIRELIQNALDSESPFEYQFIPDSDGSYIFKLSSKYSTLTSQSLLLGATSKADSDTAIGSFGEGFKIALLVLTREGYDVSMQNGDMLWQPRFKMSRGFGAEVLAIYESVLPDRTNQGLTFIVQGVDEELKAGIVASCLRMQDDIGETKTTERGTIMLDRPGELYVGDLFICKTDLKYGYNILPKYIRLERDRQTVDSWDLKDCTLRMWYGTNEMGRVAEMLYNEVPDVQYAE